MNKIGIRAAAVEEYIKLVEEGVDLVFLVSDSISTSKILPFYQRFPDRVVNVGIAEQNLIGIAAGLANGGFIPVTGNATPFLLSRSNEQVKIDASYTKSNVKITGLHAGFSYGMDGVTHHEVNDISIVRGFPAIDIFVPFDTESCKQIMRYCITEKKGPTYTSMNTGVFPIISPSNYKFEPGKTLQVKEGKDLSIFVLGTAIHDLLPALEQLKNKINADVFVISSVRPLDKTEIIKSINKTGKVLTIEEHSTHGGLGSIVAETIADNGLNAKLLRLGVPEGTFTLNNSADVNKKFFHLDSQGIESIITKNFS